MLNKYKVVEEIGQGSYGTVFLVVDEDGRRFALKSVSINPMEPERTKMEVETALALSHPNVVKVFQFEVQDEEMHILMEFCQGDSLDSYFSEAQEDQKQTRVLEVFSQLVEAGIAMTERGIVHRDLKPANLMVASEKGKRLLKIIDFGEARQIPKLEESFFIDGSFERGTAIYASPEMLANTPYNSKSDVWAAGCILFELYFGHHPFKSATVARTFDKIKGAPSHGSFPLPAPADPRIEKIINMCLQRDKNERASWREIKLSRALLAPVTDASKLIAYFKNIIAIAEHLSQQFWIMRKDLQVPKHTYESFLYFITLFQLKLKGLILGIMKKNPEFNYLVQNPLEGVDEADLRLQTMDYEEYEAKFKPIQQRAKKLGIEKLYQEKIPQHRDQTFACLDHNLKVGEIIIKSILKACKGLEDFKSCRTLGMLANWVRFECCLALERNPLLISFRKGVLFGSTEEWLERELAGK